jgi:adenosine deaminase
VHALAFDFARNGNLAVTVHAGEGDGPSSIAEALHRCAADRIGHGTRLLEDRALERYVLDRRIPLEVCPTSNVQTRVAATFAQHPLKRYVERGVVVTINTDNRMMSGVSLTDEYVRCAVHLGFDLTQLGALSLAAFDSAFVDFDTRRRLRADAARDIDTMLREASTLSLSVTA